MSTEEENMVGRLLKQSILTMCKEAVHYNSMLEIDGLICIATDNGGRQVVIKIHEVFHKLPRQNTEALSFPGEDKSIVVTQKSKNPHIDHTDTLLNSTLYARNLTEKANTDAEESDSTGDEETNTQEIRDKNTSEFPENIDKEMHTLAIYKVYKDSKSIEAKRDDFMAAGSLSTSTDRTNTHSSDKKKIREISSHTSASDAIGPGSDQRFLNLNVSERYPNLQASSLTNIPCKKCDAILENGTVYETHNANVHSVYTCFVCLSTFTSRNNMKRHIRIHSGTKPYSCPKCPERFTRKDDVKRHILRHDYNKPFRCALCGMGYTEKTTIKTHFERDHGSGVFYSCSQCGKCFDKEKDFQLHKKTHPEFREFACKLCVFTGSNSFMYLKHMLVHESDKMYICNHCNDMKFKDPFIYTAHLKEHRTDPLITSFRCCFCDVPLTSYDQFIRHEHSHIQGKRYSCKVCSKSFEWPGHLREHILCHGQDHENTLTRVIPETDISDPQDDSCSLKCDENLNEVNGSVDYWCAECSLGFPSERALEKHIVETHEAVVKESLDLRMNDVKKTYKYLLEKEEHSDDRDNYKLQTSTNDSESEPKEAENVNDMGKPINILGFSSDEREQTITGKNKMTFSDQIVKHEVYNEEAEDLSVHRREKEHDVNDSHQPYNDTLESEKRQTGLANERCITRISGDCEGRSKVLNDSVRKPESFFINKLFQVYQTHKYGKSVPESPTQVPSTGNVPRMSILRSDSISDQEPSTSPKSKLPKLFNLMFGQNPTEDGKEIKTEPGSNQIDRNNVYQTSRYPAPVTQEISYPIVKKIKIEKLDDFGPSEPPGPTDIKSVTLSSIPKPNLRDFSSPTQSMSCAEEGGSQRPQSGSEQHASTSINYTTGHSAPTLVKIKARAPGFEKVVTPEVLFRTKAPFTCEDCSSVFDDFQSFDQHGILVHHSFVCEYCGKVFTAKPNRERHVRYHTGDRPYRCELCDESYFRGDDLKYHRTAKHGDIRPYVCRRCRRSFIWKKDFEKHIRRFPDHK